MTPLLIAALVVPSVLLNGLVLVKLWEWFIAPVFHLAEIGVAQALGLALTASCFVGIKSSAEADWESMAVRMVAGPLLTFTVGWIIHLFL